jgi:AcrR family transcriptional regulator
MAVVSRKRGPVRRDALNVLRGQATRRTILAVARQRILADGFEDVRLDDIARDAERLNVMLAFAGYLWFWRGEERARAQGMVDDTRLHLCELMAEASVEALSRERLECLSRRLVAGYALGLRDLHDGRRTFEQAVRFAVRFALE